MEAREQKLTSCEPMMAAVYIDPRYQNLLSSSNKCLAKKYLEELYNYFCHRNNFMNEKNDIENFNGEPSTSKSSINRFEINDDDLLNSYMISKACTSTINVDLDKNLVRKLIESLDNLDILPTNTNVFDYWDKKDANLAKVAKIVLSAPATQVSVERVFAMLKWILTDKRNSIDKLLLEDILLIVMNKLIKEEQ